MSIVGQKPAGDQMQPSSTFSYAQAAKGRPQTQPVSRSASKEGGPSGNSPAEPSNNSSNADSAKKIENESRQEPSEQLSIKAANGEMTAEQAEKASVAQPSEVHDEASGSQHRLSAPSSNHSEPDTKTGSSRPASVREDGAPMTNGTSDTSLDKGDETRPDPEEPQQPTQSQGVESPTKAPSAHSAQSDTESQAPVPVMLKEAPPPAVNFWQQRMAQNNQATTRPKTQLSQPQTSISQPSHASNMKEDQHGGSTAQTQDGSRKPDTRRRGRLNGVPADEKNTSGISRDQKRTSDGEKGNNRHSKTGDVQQAAIKAAPLPPPTSDAISWPTPENAQDEEKRKMNDRLEKPEEEKSSVAKVPRREKWIPVQHVPTAVFNTPIPSNARRGGRAARGGREPNTRNGGPAPTTIATEKPSTSAQQVPVPLSAGASERGPNEGQMTRSSAVETKSRRASSAGALAAKDRRRIPDVSVPEASKTSKISSEPEGPNRAVSLGETSKQMQSTSQQSRQNGFRGLHNTEDSLKNGGDKAAQPPVDRYEKRNSFSQDSYAYTRSNGVGIERRTDYQSRANQPNQYAQNPVRERGESRSERNRGGSYRGGRGAASHGVPATNGSGQPMMNGNFSPHAPNGQPSSRYGNDHFAQMPQAGHLPSAPSHYRGHRSSSRSNSMQHSAPYARYAPHSAGAGPALSNIHTELANMYGHYPGNQVAMSAMPYNAFTDSTALCNMVSLQMEYYLSIENLCKDMFLRKHMDSQGYILLGVLTNFNRIRSLTQDLDIIRMACNQSPEIEFGTGPDGMDRVRKRHGWQSWVLSMEERDHTAKNDGPSELHPVQLFQLPPMYPPPYPYGIRQAESARLAPLNSHMDDVPFPMQHDLPGPSYPMGPSAGASYDHSATPTPLSAAVPEFSPQKPPSVRQPPLPKNKAPNGPPNSTPSKEESEDQPIENLKILFRKPDASTAPAVASSGLANDKERKTLQGESPKIDRRPAIPLINGSTMKDAKAAQGIPKSPITRLTSPRQSSGTASTLMGQDFPVSWTTDPKFPTEAKTNYTYAPYTDFRKEALDQYKDFNGGNIPHKMDLLYTFWSHFLLNNFNKPMYDEFRQLAVGDVQKGSRSGMNHLVNFYDHCLNSKEPATVLDDVAKDFVALIKQEGATGERPAFQTLRKNWRNGAWSMKNRSKMTKLIDNDLTKQLDG